MIPARINRPSNNLTGVCVCVCVCACVCVCVCVFLSVSAQTLEPAEFWHFRVETKTITINLLMISSVIQMIV